MISANDITDDMELKSADGWHIGTADHLEGSESIKLTRSDFPDGEHHHLIPLDWADHVDARLHFQRTHPTSAPSGRIGRIK